MILVDTSVLIDFLKGFQTEGRDKFEVVLHRKIPFGITSFILQEVLQGAASEKEFLLLKKYLLSQKFYHPKDPVDSFARAARIYMDCRKQGITVRSTIDCIIVQTTLEHDLFLLHNDSDFNAMVKVVPIKFY
jgi:predicted nucleic acid-binding protein